MNSNIHFLVDRTLFQCLGCHNDTFVTTIQTLDWTRILIEPIQGIDC